ncbi:PHD finger protein 7-like [Ostrinia furnacalis]|uniref:PHD finger protein 7-like n=1 Tax=Ostrinia furnacalis TaxID=93504 RepID=UPI00103B20D5|nr:PHD finger protein 7-like [Ostrinia furnacalis]
MAKKASVDKKLLAKLVTETADRKPCAFCQREIDDEITYGKLYSIGNIQCHYFCVLLSCCLIQKGKDEQGLFGFLYPDILAEVERSKKHRCSYCGRGGATLGCCVSQCRKQFHLPCGRERNAVSLFFGNFKSYCAVHAPKQKIADDVMAKARVRMRADKNKSKGLVTKVENLEPEESLEDLGTISMKTLIESLNRQAFG